MLRTPVIVGFDGSHESVAAVKIGARLAAAAGVALHIVIAVFDALREVAATRAGLDLTASHEAIMADARASASQALAGVVDAKRLQEGLLVRLGRPEFVLAEVTRETGAGLVVVGGHGRPTPATWFGRGVAHHLLRSVPVPLLVAGADAQEIDRVLAAVDVSFAADRVIRVARQLAALLGARLEALHVVDRAILSAAEHRPLGTDDLAADLAARAETEIWPLLDETEARRVETGEVAPTIVRVAREQPATLTVIGSHGLGWIDRILLGSTTEALLADLPSSIAVVPVSGPGAIGLGA